MDHKLKGILEVAAELFKKFGIRSISMDEIAAELGMSKKTIYQYVENKTDLVEKVLQYYTHNSNACIDEIAANMNAIDVLMHVSETVSEDISNSNPVMLFDLQKYYPLQHKQFVSKKKEHVYEKIRENILQGIKEGIYRDGLDVELVAKLYVEKLLGVHDPEFLSSMKFSQQEIFKVMFENHIRGIANASGLAYFERKLNNPTS